MNEYKAINILKAFNITPQKPISNSITTLDLMGLGSKPRPSWTNISQMRPNYKKNDYLINNPCEKS